MHWNKDMAIKVSKDATLQGWRDESELWNVPLVDKIVNVNKNTLIMDKPMPQDATINIYKFASNEQSI